MKKFLGVSLILALLTPIVTFGADDGVVTLDKNSVEKPSIAIDKGTKQLQGSLLVSDSEDLAQLIDTQIQRRLEDMFIIFQPLLLSTSRRGVSARMCFLELIVPKWHIIGIFQVYNSLYASVTQWNVTII